MPRESRTPYALLGMLTWGSMTGYELRRRMERTVSYFWSESYGQIYPALRRLEDEGLVRGEDIAQSGRPDKRVYTITESGRRVLREWLQKPAEPHRERVEALLKVVFGPESTPAVTLGHVARLRTQHTRLLEQYAPIEAELSHLHNSDPKAVYGWLVVRCGQRVSQAFVEWCEEATATLEAREGSDVE